MILLVAPGVFLIAFEPQFYQYYPTFMRCIPEGSSESNWLFIFIYELAYSVDFFSIETLFRGFFVIGLGRFIGKEVIIPMVTIYCVIHFGKPLGETISSIFGGYLLGILAFYTRSILGGGNCSYRSSLVDGIGWIYCEKYYGIFALNFIKLRST